MANPNPSPATRFSADRAGRAKQKGARDRMSAAFLTALADDFEEHGKETVVRVRQEDPSAYLRIFATLAPKELEISNPLHGMSDGELAAAIQALTDHLRGQVQAPEDEPENPQHTVN